MADRPPRLVITERRRSALRHALPWVATAAMGVIALTQALGWTGVNVVYVLQALTLPALAPSIPLALVACRRKRHAVAVVNVAIAAALLWLTAPIVFHGSPPAVAADAPTLRVVFANTYYENRDTAGAADDLLARDADLIAMAEYSYAQQRAMERAGAFDAYPYRVGMPDGDRDGIVLYSRHPFVTADHRIIGTVPGIDATVEVDGIDVRVIVVHPPAAVHQADLGDWQEDLRTLHGILRETSLPTLVVGDFNASRWHPDFRDLLSGTRFRDVHEWLGEGLSTSWPNDGLLLPRFVRIDHALVGGLVPAGIVDVDISGSDHRGFEVTVAVP